MQSLHKPNNKKLSKVWKKIGEIVNKYSLNQNMYRYIKNKNIKLFSWYLNNKKIVKTITRYVIYICHIIILLNRSSTIRSIAIKNNNITNLLIIYFLYFNIFTISTKAIKEWNVMQLHHHLIIHCINFHFNYL